MDASTPKKGKQKTYTALIYFHGVGEQKRYEEVSRLVDGLERCTPEMKQVQESPEHCLEFEPTHPGLEAALGRSQVGYLPKSYNKQEFRFYEAYYADLLAGGIRPGDVFVWALKRSIMPVRILRTYWRELPRLRRAILLGSWDKKRKKASSESNKKNLDGKVTELLKVYENFEQANEPSQAPKDGNFFKFIDTINSPPIKRNARAWFGRYLWIQFILIVLILSTLLTLFLGALGTFALLWQFGLAAIDASAPLHQLAEVVMRAIAPAWLSPPIIPTWLTILLLIGIGFLVAGLRWFLRNYAGDLYFWTTFEETSEKYAKREAILERSRAYLAHVLADERCKRVVLVGHSMGTTVVHDAILRLARNPFIREADEKPKRLKLGKIQHLITLASVIDKVYYLFETVTTRSFHYSRLLESLRKDIGNPPFSKSETDQTPHIHWINFWDRADVASSPLYTPTNRTFNPYHVVDNYEVAGVCWPDPVSSHFEYFENRFVLETISTVFFENGLNFVEALKPVQPLEDNNRIMLMDMLYKKQFIGPHEIPFKSTNWVQWFAILLPWLTLLYWIFIGFRTAELAIQFLSWAGSYILLVGLLAVINRMRRSRRRQEVIPKPAKQEMVKQP